MLNASKKRINHRERVKLMASQQIRSKNQFDAFSATLVESNELIHPRKFMRRLNWDHTSSSIKDTEHETYSINCEEQEQRRPIGRHYIFLYFDNGNCNIFLMDQQRRREYNKSIYVERIKAILIIRNFTGSMDNTGYRCDCGTSFFSSKYQTK